MFQALSKLVSIPRLHHVQTAGFRKIRPKLGLAEGIFRHEISVRLPCGSVINEERIGAEEDMRVLYSWFDQMTQLHRVDFFRRFAEFQRLRWIVKERIFAVGGEVPGKGPRTLRTPFCLEVYRSRPNPKLTPFQSRSIKSSSRLVTWSCVQGTERAFNQNLEDASVRNCLHEEIGLREAETVTTVGHTACESAVELQWPELTLQRDPLDSRQLGTMFPEYPNVGEVGIAYPYFFPKPRRPLQFLEPKSYKSHQNSVANLALHSPWKPHAIASNQLLHPSLLKLGCILPTHRQPAHYVFDVARKLDFLCIAVRPIANRTAYSKVDEQEASQFKSKLQAWGPSKAMLYQPSNYNISSVHESVRQNGGMQLAKEQKVCSDFGITRYVISPPCARLGFTGHAWCVNTAVDSIAPQLKQFNDIEICAPLGFARHKLALSNRIESVHSQVSKLRALGNNAGVVIDLVQCHLVGFDVEQRPQEFLQHLFSTFSKDEIKAIVLGDTMAACGSYNDDEECTIGSGRLASSMQTIIQSEYVLDIPVFIPHISLNNTEQQLNTVRGIYLNSLE